MTSRTVRSSAPGGWLPSLIARGWPALLPSLLICLTYLPAVRFDFVWDDTIFLRDMPVYRDPALWLPALFRPFVLSPNYFRPLVLLTFVGELRLAGLDPAFFHLTNVLLHALNTGLLALLALRLGPGRSRLLAAGAGLLYGLHPALLEAVTFVSGRFDLLMTTFLLLALLADLAVCHRVARPVLVGLAFLLAALCKEMAIALALALPFWHLARRDDRRLAGLWQERWVYLAVGLAGLAYLGLRYASLGYLFLPAPERVLSAGSPLQHLLLVVKSLTNYLLLIVWPFGSLAPIHYSDLPIPLTDVAAWAGLVVAGLLAIGFGWLLRRAPAAGWLALAGMAALLPVVNLLPLELGGGAVIAERFLLFPLTLVVLAVFWLVSAFASAETAPGRPFPRWHLVYGGAALWLLAAAVTVQLTLPHWRDDMSLWRWAASRAPRSATPPTNLAMQQIERGDYEGGLALAQQATELDPANAAAWNNAGLALIHLERYAGAQAVFEEALTLQPESALYWNNLAGALREQGDLVGAERLLLDQTLRLDPHLPSAHLSLGIVYLRADRPDLAAVHLQEAVRLLPPAELPIAQAMLDQTLEPERWLRLGDLLLAHGESGEALSAFEQADVLGGAPADVGVGLSSALIALGEWNSAIQVLNQALEIAPGDARLYNNLGLVARDQGDLVQARELFERAAELAPEWEVPQDNLGTMPSAPAEPGGL